MESRMSFDDFEKYTTEKICCDDEEYGYILKYIKKNRINTSTQKIEDLKVLYDKSFRVAKDIIKIIHLEEENNFSSYIREKVKELYQISNSFYKYRVNHQEYDECEDLYLNNKTKIKELEDNQENYHNNLKEYIEKLWNEAFDNFEYIKTVFKHTLVHLYNEVGI